MNSEPSDLQISTFRTHLERFFARRGVRRDDIQDLVQEVLFKYVRMYAHITEPPVQFRLLNRISQTMLGSYHRATSKQPEAMSQVIVDTAIDKRPSPQLQTEFQEFITQVEDTLRRSDESETLLTIFRKRFRFNNTLKEISIETGLATSTVHNYINDKILPILRHAMVAWRAEQGLIK